MKLVVVTAGLTQPSSTRLLADRLTEATVRRLTDRPAEVTEASVQRPTDRPTEVTDATEASVGRLGDEAAGLGDERATEVRVIELRDLAVDIANNFVTGFPGARLSAAIEAVTEADGLIAVTPVFSASYSGLFKSFFDVIDPASLAGKPTLIAATGGTPRHSLALEHALRPLFAYLRAMVAPTAVYAAAEDWGGGGDDFADGLAERIDRAATELADLLRSRTPAPAGTALGDAAGSGPRRGAGRQPELEPDVVPFEQQLAALRR
ncbi:CE1759 family FMN reductase [Nonomuraea sp. CA-143628]|uniref:CE1759 family FMN reductase n=1 Tax=Nonomuraea sp. CA-143628 TaxID=3239997 RepID=UPI003D93CF46